MPAIGTDIDGVLVRGSNPIDRSREGLIRLFQPLESGKTIPFTCLTNGGGSTEKKKVAKLNKQLQLTSRTGQLTEKELIQSHTVFSDPSFLEKYQDKWILVEGLGYEDVKIAESYGYKKAISLMEVMSLYPTAAPTAIVDL